MQWWQRIRPTLGSMQSVSRALDARKHFEERSLENPRDLLLAEGLKSALLASVVKEWAEFANNYEIEAGKLRPGDHVEDVVRTDWFGDRGLFIEARLTRLGLKEVPPDMTVIELLLLLSDSHRDRRG